MIAAAVVAVLILVADAAALGMVLESRRRQPTGPLVDGPASIDGWTPSTWTAR